ncbi:PLP-dependent aminotransferase family protein [Methylobrevis pamukkalensis]|uniref:2-aminoadipate transaminase n=1 Tax=Methylobrevis pamukkalensis TaxID=1439726 RepID=A0A1E3H616_9HYPH|nr:PLP-dependent aminotransferase family protein [Methylobrevis pamukkalensis]ODN71778.1 2-aminoadipate transaminase [Methylobrevis pamukkalensis]
MWQPRIRTGAPSKFMGLVEAIEEDIETGLLGPGQRMPAQRSVASVLGIDLTTVTRAYTEARIRGVLSARPGRGGTWVAAGAESTTHRLLTHPVDLGMNIPPQPFRADIGGRLGRAVVDVLRGESAFLQYGPSEGTLADRHAGAAFLLPAGEPDADRIVVSAGAQAALMATLHLLACSGDRVAAGTVAYPGLADAARQVGARPVGLAVDDEGIDPDAFAAACRTAAPKLLYLVPTMDNPTTATMPIERRQAIIAIARRHGVMLVEDDPYRRLDPDAPAALAALAPDITVHIATLSKIATPALRIAYLVAPSLEQALDLGHILRATTLMASPLTAAVASRWIADGTLQRITAEIAEECAARQAIAARLLAGLDVAAHPCGPHLWLRLPAPWRADAFTASAARSGVAVVPAAHFAVDAAAPQAVRISLGAATDRRVLAAGLKFLAELAESPKRAGS